MQNLRAPRIDVVALVSTIVTVLLMLLFMTNVARRRSLGKIRNVVVKTLPSAAAPATSGVKTGAVTLTSGCWKPAERLTSSCWGSPRRRKWPRR
jgi:hypothetical protein